MEIAYFCCPTNSFCLYNSTYPGLLVVKVRQKQTIATPWTFNAQDKVGTGSSNDWNKVGLLGVVIINHHLLPGLLVQTLDVFLAFVHDFGTGFLCMPPNLMLQKTRVMFICHVPCQLGVDHPGRKEIFWRGLETSTQGEVSVSRLFG